MSCPALPSAWLRLVPLLLVAAVSAQNHGDVTCEKPTDPKGVAVHDSGALYVLDPGQGVIHEFNGTDGQYMRMLTTSIGAAAGGLTVFGDSLYVSPASETDGTVEVISVGDSGVTMKLPDQGETVARGGYDVAVDANGTVYVSNYLDVGVRVYNGTTGDYLGDTIEDMNVLGLAFGPDDILYATVPADDSVKRYERSSDGTNFTLIDAPITGLGGSRNREGVWGIAVNQKNYMIYVVWSGSQEVTGYDSQLQEMNWWGIGTIKTWWTSDPDSSVSTETSVSNGWTNAGSNSSNLTPWFVTTDTVGDIYVTASDESANGLDGDVFKYDGETNVVIGRLSNCLGAGANPTDLPTPSPSIAPTHSHVTAGANRTELPTPSPSITPTLSRVAAGMNWTELPTPSPTVFGQTAGPTAVGSDASDGTVDVDDDKEDETDDGEDDDDVARTVASGACRTGGIGMSVEFFLGLAVVSTLVGIF